MISKKEKKNKEVITETDKDKSMIFYGIVFIIIIVVALITKFAGSSVKEDTKSLKEESVETVENISFEKIKANNYDSEIFIITNNDMLNLIIRRENINKEIVSKTYNKKETNYFRIGYDIYELRESGKYSVVNNVKFYEDYDDTFLKIDNIILLLDSSKKYNEIEEDKYYIYEYKIDVDKIIEIYNKYTNKGIDESNSESTYLKLKVSDNEVIGYSIDLTSFYQSLEKDYRKVEYTVDYQNFGEINLNEFESLIEKNN